MPSVDVVVVSVCVGGVVVKVSGKADYGFPVGSVTVPLMGRVTS